MLTKNLKISTTLQFSALPILGSSLWATAVVVGHTWLDIEWLSIPFMPITLIGTAVSFYLGFKSNASNQRLNDARQYWGEITNNTRALIAMLDTYLPKEVAQIKTNLLKRHIVWLYAHKFFLRHKRMDWEHNLAINNQYRKAMQQSFDLNTDLKMDVQNYLSDAEYAEINTAANIASKVLQIQSREIKALGDQNLVSDYRLVELQNHITKFYESQGKNERIKTFPMPRQYARFTFLYVLLFVFLLPMGMITEMKKYDIWLTVPFAVIVSWVFLMMETVGNYSENPFEGLILDVPISAITRNLEIEILEYLDDPNKPKPIVPIDGILM